MTWSFENDTSSIERKLAERNLKSGKRRNLMVVIAVALVAFLICFAANSAVLAVGLFLFVLFGMELILSVWMARRQEKQSLVEQMRAQG